MSSAANNISRFLPATLGALLIAGTATVSWQRLSSDARTAVPSAASPRADSDEVRALRSEVLRLQQRLSAQQGVRANSEPASAVEPKAAAEAAPAPTPEQEAAWLDARAAFYDEFFEQEARDEVWASRMEAKVREVTAKQKERLGVDLVAVRCWSSVCRVEFAYIDGPARLQHIHTLGREYRELPTISYAYPGEPQDHKRLVAYMAVDGHSLPPFEYSTFAALATGDPK